jgi:hypothetical protein
LFFALSEALRLKPAQEELFTVACRIQWREKEEEKVLKFHENHASEQRRETNFSALKHITNELKTFFFSRATKIKKSRREWGSGRDDN